MSTRPAPRFSGREADWLEVNEAMARTLGEARALSTETVSLTEAEGRALAEPIVATATLPPWDNSAMDGYAVRGADIGGATPEAPVVLPVAGVVRAGQGADASLPPGEAIRIMTGAPVPRGADTVVRVEDTDAEQGTGQVSIYSDRDRGRHIRDAGQDMREGTTLFEVGQSIFPGVIGVLAAAGRAEVVVRRRPRVAILTTGDELRSAARYEEVRSGAGVPESNGPMLASMVRAVGADPILVGPASDDPAHLRECIERGRWSDVLVTVGGASMGEADLVKRVLQEMGFSLDFWRVRMRPGSPISFGWLPAEQGRLPVFGLPGNPSSAFVTFELFVRPFLLRLAGHRHVRRRSVPCRAAERFDTPAELTYFQRVRLDARDGEMHASLTGPQISGLVTGLALADGLAVVPPSQECVEPGEPVQVMLLDTGPAALGGERLG